MTIVAPPAPPSQSSIGYFTANRPVRRQVRNNLIVFDKIDERYVFKSTNPHVIAWLRSMEYQKFCGIKEVNADEYAKIKTQPKEEEKPVVPAKPKFPNQCIIQLGRTGDIINILPVCKHIADTTHLPPVLVCCEEFSGILDGVSYVEKRIFKGPMGEPFRCKAELMGDYGNIIMAQTFGRGWTPEHKTNCFLREQWRLLDYLPEWMNLPLIFDRRDAGREARLINQLWPTTDKPVVLTNWYGISGPFHEKDRMKAQVWEWLKDKATVLDLTGIKAERIYDLLALYEMADLLITVDTATLHLARASRIPVVSFVREGWCGAERIRNCIFHCHYEEAFNLLPEIEARINMVVGRPKLFTFYGPFDSSSGYGKLSADAAMAFHKAGHAVECVPIDRFVTNELPTEIASSLRMQSADNFPIITKDLHHWDKNRWLQFAAGKFVTAQYLYETDRIPENGVKNLNRCNLVITPTRWGASVMRKSGVTSPIKVVPLGIDTAKYPIMPLSFEPFVFGAAGQLSGGGTRKNLDLIIQAFKIAFPANDGVRLRLKVFPNDTVPNPNDARIEITKAHLPHDQLVDWLSHITVFMSASSAEGWGYWLQQAMCMGRPVMTPIYSGETEFVNERNAYALKYDVRPASGHYTGQGNFAYVSLDSLVEQMRLAHTDRNLLLKKSEAALSARHYTIERYQRGMVNALMPVLPTYWHVYCVYDKADDDVKRRNNFALDLWKEQYAWGKWKACPVADGDLPRLFDDNGRQLPFIKDVIERAAQQAGPNDVIVYCNTDNCPSPTLAYQLINAMQNHPCAYSYRRDVDRSERLTDEQIRQGQVYAGSDLFVMKAQWWNDHKDEFPDFVLGGEGWDWCMRVFMEEHGGKVFKYLVYHEKHTPRWRLTPELRETLPCQVVDRQLSSQFLRARGIIPNWEPGGQRNLNPI